MNLLYDELFHARQADLLRDAYDHRLTQPARPAEARSPRRRTR